MSSESGGDNVSEMKPLRYFNYVIVENYQDFLMLPLQVA
jgi:hypothetical protein